MVPKLKWDQTILLGEKKDCMSVQKYLIMLSCTMTTQLLLKQVKIWLWTIDLLNNYFYRENTSTAKSSWMSGSHYFISLNAAFDQLHESSPEGCVLITKYQAFDIEHPMFRCWVFCEWATTKTRGLNHSPVFKSCLVSTSYVSLTSWSLFHTKIRGSQFDLLQKQQQKPIQNAFQ